MKNKLILAFIVALALQSSGCYAQTTQEAINSGAETVKESLNEMIQKLEERKVSPGFHASDYWAQMNDGYIDKFGTRHLSFIRHSKEAFSTFQKSVGDEKQGILAKLAFFMDAYNNAYLNSDYGAAEKQNKISIAKKQLDAWTITLTVEYQNAIRFATRDLFDERLNNYDPRTDENLVIVKYEDLYWQTLKGGCKTKICLSLRGADLASLATLFKSNIDRDLTLYLVDKTPVTLKSLDVDIDAIKDMFLGSNYPEQLPFDTEN